MLRVIQSNSLHRLMELYVSKQNTIKKDPLATIEIVVQSKGMSDWIEKALAKKWGICANVTFPFPKKIIFQTFNKILAKNDHSDNSLSVEKLIFSIMKLLPKLRSNKDFQPLAHYLMGGDTHFKLFELSEKIAKVFDQYMIYRYEMLLKWEQQTSMDDFKPEQGAAWQEPLWKAIISETDFFHAASLLEDFSDKILASESSPSKEVKCVSFFGISTLPPLYVKIIDLLSKVWDIDYYLLSPFRGNSNRPSDEAASFKDLNSKEKDILHPLLSSMGTLHLDFLRIIHENTLKPVWEDAFVDLKRDTDLKRLQNDILNSISPSFPVKEDASFKGDRADNSVLLHSCFNRLREIEVLKDQLLFLLSKDPTLKPNDILVMAPEIEVYAGLIDAVFDVEHNREDFISYVIADRSIKNESIALKSLFQILELPQKRLSVSQVVELLFFQPVREKYNISLDDLDIILNWVKKSGIRWGIDKEHRQAWNYPDSFENTWRFGLNRLFLSISIPSNEDEIFVDTLPFGEIESEKAVILGNFAEFLEDIFSWVEKLSKNSKIRDWEAIILEIAEKSILFKIEDAWASSLLSEALNEIIKDSELADFNENISLKVIKTILDQRLQSTLPHHHFTAQGITFCGMKPMRNIPFKVICLIGMNENDFPRKDSSLSFDLMRHERRPGDPERSMEDRYLFLEALLAAQDHFVVTYLGKNPLDGRSLSPSNVVYDLLESLADTLNPRADQVEDFNDARLEKEKIKESFIVQHPLEAFHPIYFNPDHPRHFSFSNENALAAKNLLGLKKRKTPFIDKTLPRLNSTEEIPLRDFTRFFKDPGAFFLSKRFELYLKEENFVLEDLEPIDLCGLDFYQAATLWLKRYPLDKGGVKTFERLQKSGILPFGTLGQVRYDKLNDRAGNLISELNRYSPESFQPKQYEVKVILDHNIRLFGSDTDFFTQDGLAILTPSKEKAKNLIECWIKHLLLSCMNDKKAYRKLVYIYWNKDKINAESKIFDEIADPGKHLADLVDLYLLGQNEPLAFFPETSLAYAREIFNLKGSSDETTALNKARKVWDADNGDGKQESNRLLYADLDVFNLLTLDLDVPFHGDFTPTHDFQDLAKSIFQPMLECLK